MTTVNEDRSPPATLRAQALRALDEVHPAVTELARALADLRDGLPPEHRAEAARTFMNALGNAVVAEAKASEARS